MIDAIRIAVALAGGLLLPTAAHAEALKVAGVYPAASDGAAAMNTIVIEQFGGPDGPDLAIRIGDALGGVEIGGRRYFRILAGSGSAREADGVLRGTATAEITRERYTESRKKCVAKDDNGKCTERRKEDVRCTRRWIELVPNIRLIARQGDLVHADAEPESRQDSRCEDDPGQFASPETIVREMADRIARACVPRLRRWSGRSPSAWSRTARVFRAKTASVSKTRCALPRPIPALPAGNGRRSQMPTPRTARACSMSASATKRRAIWTGPKGFIDRLRSFRARAISPTGCGASKRADTPRASWRRIYVAESRSGHPVWRFRSPVFAQYACQRHVRSLGRRTRFPSSD